MDEKKVTKIPSKKYDLGIWRFKENPIKRKIKRGELVLGLYNRWWVHGLEMNHVQFAAQAGYDYVVIDTEHTPWFGLESCQTFVMACEAFGIVPFVRVSTSANPILIMKALDMGFYGVWVPHVNNKKDMERVVAAAKYKLPGWEYGARGTSSGYYSDGYGTTPDRVEYQKFSNEETMVVALPLEEFEGIQNIDEIISVPGLDMISLSSGDISQCLGYPGQPMHPEVMKVRDRVVELCNDKGILTYCLGSPAMYKYYWEKGVRCFHGGPNDYEPYKNHVKQVKSLFGLSQ